MALPPAPPLPSARTAKGREVARDGVFLTMEERPKGARLLGVGSGELLLLLLQLSESGCS